MDGRPTWTDCEEAGDYVVPNVLSPRDLVFRPDNMDETVLHTCNEIIVMPLGKHRNEIKLKGLDSTACDLIIVG